MSTEKRELGRIYTDENIKKQAELDKKMIEVKWRELEEKLSLITKKELAEDIVNALRELYSIYNKEQIVWIANLYDPTTGGFYYSNSARDNEEVECEGKIYKLRPDLESTSQATGMLITSHMADSYDGSIADALPEWMGKQIAEFAKNLQDEETGYFYHPQWGKERTNKWKNRRGRDLQWGIRLLDRFNDAPLYKTPLEDRSDDNSVKRSPHLESKEAFIEFLNGYKIDPNDPYSAYRVGNQLESQSPEIAARDAELKKLGADYSLTAILKEWLDARYNAENGTWTNADLCYDSCNGILKICSTYAKCGIPLPDPIAPLKVAIKCITLQTRPDHICCILNPWYALNTIISIIKNSTAYSTEKISEILENMNTEILKNYPEMIRITAEKLKIFLKEDGSFSYNETHSCHYSQMMPVAIPNTNEGDFNATSICTVSIPTHIFDYLGIRSIPLYTEADRMRLVSLLEKNKRNAKGENQ